MSADVTENQGVAADKMSANGKEYRYEQHPWGDDGAIAHYWILKGQKGGIHISARPILAVLAWHGEEFMGGIECHSPIQRFWGGEPSHTDCWVIGGPCWHDGSSLYFSERIEPLLRGQNGNFDQFIHDRMNFILDDWYRDKFENYEPEFCEPAEGTEAAQSMTDPASEPNPKGAS